MLKKLSYLVVAALLAGCVRSQPPPPNPGPVLQVHRVYDPEFNFYYLQVRLRAPAADTVGFRFTCLPDSGLYELHVMPVGMAYARTASGIRCERFVVTRASALGRHWYDTTNVIE